MVALATNTPRRTRGDMRKSTWPIAANVRIYAGSLVMIDSAGRATPAVAAAGNLGCVGCAVREYNNVGGAADAFRVEVEEGEFLFTAVSIALANTMRGMYALDDNTVDETQLANQPLAGILTQFIAATQGWVRVTADIVRGILGA